MTTGISTGVKTDCTCMPSSSGHLETGHGDAIYNTKKLILHIQCPLAGTRDELLVINVHALNFASTFRHQDQLSQHHQSPMILAGDFNTWNKKRFFLFSEITRSFNLTELNIARTPRLRHFNQHLDHAFYRDLEPTHSRTLKDVKSSDYFPIQMGFKLA